MERLTVRNSEGVAVLKTPYQCERCGEEIYRLADYGNGEPIEKLAGYEELQEQGRLLELPCAVGSRVYELYQFMGEGPWEIDVHIIRLEDLEKIGKTVFLTPEEAEAALKELKEGRRNG